MVWAAFLALGPDRDAAGSMLAMLSEFFRYGAWLFMLTGLTRTAGIAAVLSRLVHVAWIGLVIALVALPLLAVVIWFWKDIAMWANQKYQDAKGGGDTDPTAEVAGTISGAWNGNLPIWCRGLV